MRFRPEPASDDDRGARAAVLLVNLGSPAAPTAAAVRRYLAEFLADPRVVELPRALWWPLLHGIVLRTRPARSAAKYAAIWRPEGAPLAHWTERQATLLAAALGRHGQQRLLVRHAMRYGTPSIAATLDALRADGATRIVVVPLYPQYAAATAGSVADALGAWSARARRVPEWRFVADHHDDAGYIDALARRLGEHWRRHGRAERLVLSFHGLPRRAVALGDPYQRQCLATAQLLRARLGLAPESMRVSFQSRFGAGRWLEPYTEPLLRGLAAERVRSVDVMCPGFVADCLETLEEIDREARAAFLAAGGAEFRYVACLNDDPAWIGALASIVERHLRGWAEPGSCDAAAPEPRRTDAPAAGTAQ
jgi:ferrochelatase